MGISISHRKSDLSLSFSVSPFLLPLASVPLSFFTLSPIPSPQSISHSSFPLSLPVFLLLPDSSLSFLQTPTPTSPRGHKEGWRCCCITRSYHNNSVCTCVCVHIQARVCKKIFNFKRQRTKKKAFKGKERLATDPV